MTGAAELLKIVRRPRTGLLPGLVTTMSPPRPGVAATPGQNQLVLIPTAADSWARLSDGSRTDRPYPDVSRSCIPTNAFSNSCFVAYANRCGEERVEDTVMAGYLGNSIVCGPHGDVLVAARPEPTLLLADCIPGDYGPSHPAGTRHLDDLRPELYRFPGGEHPQRRHHDS